MTNDRDPPPRDHPNRDHPDHHNRDQDDVDGGGRVEVDDKRL